MGLEPDRQVVSLLRVQTAASWAWAALHCHPRPAQAAELKSLCEFGVTQSTTQTQNTFYKLHDGFLHLPASGSPKGGQEKVREADRREGARSEVGFYFG